MIGNNLAALSDAFRQSFSCCSKTGLFIYVLCVCVCVCVYLLLCLNHVSCCHVHEDNFAFDFSLCSDARLLPVTEQGGCEEKTWIFPPVFRVLGENK